MNIRFYIIILNLMKKLFLHFIGIYLLEIGFDLKNLFKNLLINNKFIKIKK